MKTLNINKNKMKCRSLCASMGALLLLSMGSCINEWPHPEEIPYNVTINVHSDTDWIPDYTMYYTRGEDLVVAYEFKIYPKGNTTDPVNTFTIYKDDLNRGDFSVNLTMPDGDYDIYVWSDLCDASNNQSLYYDSENFAGITYKKPYVGDTNNKDAFRGNVSLSIEASMEQQPSASVTVNLVRPFARYMFIATDVEDFINSEQKRAARNGKTLNFEGQTAEDNIQWFLENYTARVIYPLYMPAVFNNFLDRPIDSWTGVSFDTTLSKVSDTEANVGMDYVMVNGNASTVQVALEIYDTEGTMVSRVNTINIPTLRDRTTIVYGRFLTTLEQGGVSIDPNFSGEFNIEVK